MDGHSEGDRAGECECIGGVTVKMTPKYENEDLAINHNRLVVNFFAVF